METSRPTQTFDMRTYLIGCSATLSLLIVSALSTGIAAQEKEAKAPPQAPRELLNRQGTPRLTMQTLLEGTPEEQIECLDLSELSLLTEDSRQAKGAEFAYQLREAVTQIFDVALMPIPNESDAAPYSLNSQSHRLGPQMVGQQREQAEEDLKKIVIEKQQDGLWRFSAATVEAIPEIAERWIPEDRPTEVTDDSHRAKMPFSMWLRRQFPKSLQGNSKRELEEPWRIPPYQWICMTVVVGLGFLADFLVRRVLNALTGIWLHLQQNEERQVRKRVWRPVGLLMQGAVWYYGTKWIGLPPVVLDALVIGLKGFTIIAAIWTAWLFTDLVAHVAQRRAERTPSRFDDLIVTMTARSLKAIAVIIGGVTFAQAFGLPITGLVGGLGIGGIAVGLAAQDAISNFFGSLTVLVDRPFEVGDWVVTDGVEGTVEAVGFRSTRIRTFHNSLITLPNSKLTTAAVDNMGKREYRRFTARLGVQYDTTPEQVTAFCEGIRELLRLHPHTRKDYFEVHLNEFSDSSLNVLLYCFFECSSWSTELSARHRLLIDILRLAKELKISFAFPTQTLHLHAESSDSEELPIWSEEDGKRIATRLSDNPVADG